MSSQSPLVLRICFLEFSTHSQLTPRPPQLSPDPAAPGVGLSVVTTLSPEKHSHGGSVVSVTDIPKVVDNGGLSGCCVPGPLSFFLCLSLSSASRPQPLPSSRWRSAQWWADPGLAQQHRRPGQGSETLPFPVPLPTQLLWIEGNRVEVQIYNYIFVPMDPLGGIAKPWITSQNNVYNP